MGITVAAPPLRFGLSPGRRRSAPAVPIAARPRRASRAAAPRPEEPRQPRRTTHRLRHPRPRARRLRHRHDRVRHDGSAAADRGRHRRRHRDSRSRRLGVRARRRHRRPAHRRDGGQGAAQGPAHGADDLLRRVAHRDRLRRHLPDRHGGPVPRGIPHGAFFGIGSVVAASPSRTSAARPLSRRCSVASASPTSSASARDPAGPALLVAPALPRRRRSSPWSPSRRSASSCPTRPERRGVDALRDARAAPPAGVAGAAIGVVGFGGMFAMYSFITPTMTELAGLDGRYIPWVLAAYGIGMVAGMALSGRVANRVGAQGHHHRAALIGVLLAVSGGRRRCCGSPSSWSSCSACCPRSSCRCCRRGSWTSRTRAVARGGAQPLDPQHGQRARRLARLARARRRVGLRRAEPRRAGLAALGVGVALLSAALERRARAAGPRSQEPTSV